MICAWNVFEIMGVYSGNKGGGDMGRAWVSEGVRDTPSSAGAARKLRVQYKSETRCNFFFSYPPNECQCKTPPLMTVCDQSVPDISKVTVENKRTITSDNPFFMD